MEAAREAVEELKGIANRLVELRKAGREPAVLQGAANAGVPSLLRLCGAVRAAVLEADASRERVQQAKAQMERGVMALHSHAYERRFYEKEIAACYGFRSAFPDDQICVEPEAAAAAAAAAPGAPPPDPHARMLARLTLELEARKALSGALAAARAAREAEAAAAAALRARLEAVAASLRAVGAARQPLAKVLGARVPLEPRPRLAAGLPLPLWVIYSQLAAGRDALGLPIAARIEGTQAAAEAAEAEAEAEAAAARQGGGRGGSAAGADAIYRVHPLSTVVSLFSSSQQQQQQQEEEGEQGAPLLEVHFCYYPAAGLVGARCVRGGAEAGALLSALFPGDTGDGEGFELLAQLAGPGPYAFGSAAAPARPYRWAQDLGGAELLPSLPPPAGEAARLGALEALAARQRQQRVQALVQRLQQVAAGG
ncbi:hypothetical protein Rsub_05442 [Raphidocelis subcapitata]|uniref:Uncharacterized protein n=1 Tax=Raphidocelis subcapitata TaxID=307507 RepID=A0A2V0P4N8_9CHLO|nr:hypothetical protein Rsub_05442 [Raphidocelis subcapitata]|eukprot:GBF92823.1 hypothetical protein Rsub_05442 [Raphidocelis subcapitata]